MADINPTSLGGATPPRPAEASKVQPKKETVRINLPPKPTSAPTIKLPTLAPGAPPPSSGAAAPVAASAAPSAASHKAAPAPPVPPAASAAPRAGVITSVLGPVAKPAPPPPASAPRPMAAPMVMGLTGLDKGLAIAAAVISLAALGCVVYLAFILKDPAAM
jgi:hypothetical protein